MNADEFRQELRERGYGDAEIMEFEPNREKEMHTHDQSAMSLVISGEFTLALESGSTTYGPDEWCENPAGTSHTERIGPNGAKVLPAKK